MSDLTAAVLAAIAERREAAEAATPGPWTAVNGWIAADEKRHNCALGPEGQHEPFCGLYALAAINDRDATFIAANDPTFALADLDAWEAVVHLHAAQTVERPGFVCCPNCDYRSPCPTATAAARLFLTAEQLAEHGVEPVPS